MSDTKKITLFRRLMITFIVTTVIFGAGLGFVIYSNYDYFVFKILIAGNYIYPDALDVIYKDQLGEENVKNYYKNFDAAVIGVFTEKIRETNQDWYKIGRASCRERV